MDVVFRKFPPLETLTPQTGEIYLAPLAAAERRRRTLASYVFEKGIEGLVRATGPLDRIVVDIDPKLDDMLALSILEAQLQRTILPQGLEWFARYSAQIREGIRPTSLPLESSLEGIYLAMRAKVEKRLSDQEAAAGFLDDWRRLSATIFAAAKQQLDPFTDPLFGAPRDAAGTSMPLKSVFQPIHSVEPSAETTGDFRGEIELLLKDRDVYRSDFERAERGIVRVPGEKEPIAGVLLREPKSAFLKYWTKSVCPSPMDGPYPFLALRMSQGQWVFTTDPARKISLKPLADALQAEERKASKESSEKDPWFDGAALGHTQIASPRGGTKLSDEAVHRVLKSWGWSGPSSRRSRGTFLAAGVAAAVVVLLVGAAIAFLRPPRDGEADKPFHDVHDLYVISVGVSNYKNPTVPPLTFADTDADALAEAFRSQQGRLCLKVETKVFKDNEATKENIVDYALADWLLQQRPLTRRSLAVIAFSGHGFVQPSTGRYHFAPYDYDPQKSGTTGIFLTELHGYLKRLPCPSVVLLDTCHSGASDESQGDENRTEKILKSLKSAVDEDRNQKGLVVIAACGGSQKANETARWQHGALTLSLLEGMSGKQLYEAKDLAATTLPRANAQGFITLKELDRYVTERVEVLSSEVSSRKDRRQMARTFAIGDVSLDSIPIAVRK